MLARPSPGPISKAGKFGHRTLAGEPTTFHGGIDYVGALGSPVRAVKDGVVVVAAPNGTYSRYGNLIVIKHNDPSEAPYSLYAHLNSIRVRKGQRVRAGRFIGTMGNTSGDASNPGHTVRTHLHFELLKAFPAPSDVGRIDPGPYLDPSRQRPATPAYTWTSPQLYADQGPLLYSDASPMLSGFANLDGTRWTSNNVAPFSRAPGAGLRGVNPLAGQPGLLRARSRRASNTSFESGFAADAVGAPAAEPDILVVGQGPFTVRRVAVAQGEIPSALLQFYFTDRGTFTKSALDTAVAGALRQSGFRVSRATRFEPVAVAWRWSHDTQADFYFPVMRAPAALVGMRYSGNAIRLPAYTASAAELAKLPTQIYVYTLAVTSSANTMPDADASKVLTTLRQAMTATFARANAFANVHVTVRGSSPDVFDGAATPQPLPPVVKLGISSLVLVAAIQLLSSHVGAGA